ncbi:hypothetical protein KW882_04770 [Vibrio parahaemolyticus]
MTAPSWDLSFLYRGEDDPKLDMDVIELKQITNLLKSKFNAHHELSECDIEPAIRAIHRGNVLVVNLTCFMGSLQNQSAANAVLGEKLVEAKTQCNNYKLAKTPVEFYLTYECSDDCFYSFFEETNCPVVSTYKNYYELIRDGAGYRRRTLESETLMLTMNQLSGKHAWQNLYTTLTQKTIKFGINGELKGFQDVGGIIVSSANMDERERAWKLLNDGCKKNEDTFCAITNGMFGAKVAELEYYHSDESGSVGILDATLNANRLSEDSLLSMNAALLMVRERMQAVAEAVATCIEGKPSKYQPWYIFSPSPFSNKPNINYTFEEAISLIRRALNKFDLELVYFLDWLVEKNLIDAEPREGKRGGAYCTGAAEPRLPLVFTNFKGTERDVVTLGHEIGHAIHRMILRQAPLPDSYYPTSIAETASIFVENLVRSEIEQSSPLGQTADSMWSEVTSMVDYLLLLPARFELEFGIMQERCNKTLSVNKLKSLSRNAHLNWFGSASGVAPEYTWASGRHFNMADISFYNYQYTFGALLATGIYRLSMDAEDKQAAYSKFKEFLLRSGKEYPEALLHEIYGIDLTKIDFWENTLAFILERMDTFCALASSKERSFDQ